MGNSPAVLIGTITALLVGLAFGAGVVWKMMRGRLEAAVRRLDKESRERTQQAMDKLRNDLTRAQTAMSELSASRSKELAAAAAEPRAALVRMEQRLEIAYAELDRMRGESGKQPHRASVMAVDKDGFAATQPLV